MFDNTNSEEIVYPLMFFSIFVYSTSFQEETNIWCLWGKESG